MSKVAQKSLFNRNLINEIKKCNKKSNQRDDDDVGFVTLKSVDRRKSARVPGRKLGYLRRNIGHPSSDVKKKVKK